MSTQKRVPRFVPLPAAGLTVEKLTSHCLKLEAELLPPSCLIECENRQPGDLQEMGSLQLRASQGDAAEVQSLLEAGADVDGRDSEGCSALHWAADRGHTEVSC